MWDRDLPAGIARAEDEQAFPTSHFAPVEDALCFVSYYYSTYPNLQAMFCELTGSCNPNLLPVAGGGTQPSRYVLPYRTIFLLPESSSEGIRHLWFVFSYHVSYLSRAVTHHLS